MTLASVLVKVLIGHKQPSPTQLTRVVQPPHTLQPVRGQLGLRAAIFEATETSVPSEDLRGWVFLGEVFPQGIDGGEDELAVAADFTSEQEKSVLSGFFEGFEDGRVAGGQFEGDGQRFASSAKIILVSEVIGECLGKI